MSLCEQLSDRMPAVASGASAWSHEEAAHLERCDWCRGEWDVVRAAAALGRDLPVALDPLHVTQRVVGRLRADRAHARHRRVWIAGLAAAAVIVLAVATGSHAPRSAIRPPVDVGALRIPLPELDSLRPDELQAVLDSMDQPDAGAAGVTGADTDGMSGMDANQLESVLRSLEG
jgi:hypothetical protein